jgi:TonB-linked SusC/RagA family outer membrane protein
MEKLKLIKCWKTLLLLIGMSMFSGTLFAQNPTISGKVVDQNGQTLIGATVKLKGAQQATTTDVNGHFSIELPSGINTITVSYLGYYTKDAGVKPTSKNITITLDPNPNNLNEVVVVGYGSQKKRDVTGALVTVTGKTLNEAPSSDFVNELKGRAAGVDIVSNGSNPGSTSQIRIRGNRTITPNNTSPTNVNALDQPLIVVDGIPFGGAFSDLDQNNVESIEILKDASATAIYGSRGSGGVILVTTKRGKAGKTVVSYDTYYGIQNILGELKVYNGPQYAQFKADAAAGNSQPGAANTNPYQLTPTEQAGLTAGTSTDWQKLIYQTGHVLDNELNVSGGDDKTQYGMGAGYFTNAGVIPNQRYERYSLRSTIDHKFNDHVRVGLNSLNTLQYTNTPGGSNVPLGLIKMSPLVAPYNPDGSVNLTPQVGSIDASQVNPLTLITDAQAILNQDRKFRSFNSIYGEVSFLKYFKYRLNVGLDWTQDNNNQYTGANTYVNSSITTQANSTAAVSNAEAYTYTIENLLTYDRTFAQKHHVTFTGLLSEQKDHYESSGFNALGVPADYIQNKNFALAASTSPQNGNYYERGLLSYMARVNYSYDNRYVLTATIREDGSSVLAPGHQYFTYPALAAAWNITNEQFMKGVEFVDNLKLRVGWGKTGNQGTSPYQTLGLLSNTYNGAFGPNTPITYNYGTSAAGQQNGYIVNQLANPALRWQSTAEWNIGLDFGILKDRITGTIDAYKQNTSDILVNNILPPSQGATSQLTNLGKSMDKGLEISISSINIQTKNFRWSTDLVWAANREAITALPNGAQSNVNNLWFVGQPLSVIYDYKKIGIWQTGDPGLATQTSPKQVAGQIKVQDVNGDGIISAADKQVIGNFQPQWTSGLTNRFSYKSFDLSIVMYSRIGMDVVVPYISTDAASNGAGFFLQGRTNQVRVNYWTPTNPTNDFPRPDASVSGPTFGSTLQYVDGSFIKCRSINFGYTLPSQWLAGAGISSLRIYVTALNPFIIYSPFVKAGYGTDPEGNGYGGAVAPFGGNSTTAPAVVSQQITVNANNPATRQFNLGLSVKF